MLTQNQFAQIIDHAVLKPTDTDTDLTTACQIALQYSVASVCVKPSHVLLAADLLAHSPVAVSTVINFPHGSNTTQTNTAQARIAVDQGATELDMVINLTAAASHRWSDVEADIKAVRQAVPSITLKVILETCYHSDPDKVRLCQIAENAGAQFVKTSTGFAPAGATPHDVELMRQAVSPAVQVKASGGIRTIDAALALHQAGATRLGLSATEALIQQLQDKLA